MGHVKDLQHLKTNIDALTEKDWAQSSRHTQFNIHKETQSIQLLADDMSHTPPVKTAYYDRFAADLEPILMMRQIDTGRAELIRILFARLNAKSEIKPHVDKGYSLINCNRYIPIITNDEVSFSVGGVSNHLVKVKYGKSTTPTCTVTNASENARIHLIVDWTLGETLREKTLSDGPSDALSIGFQARHLNTPRILLRFGAPLTFFISH